MYEPEFLTVEEVAKLLRISVRTVQRLLKGGELPGVRIGRQWRIPRAELMARLGLSGQLMFPEENHDGQRVEGVS